jgi:hypothetical protein
MTSAEINNLNVSYDIEVNIGPITGPRFHNDYNATANKSGNLNVNTVINIIGVMSTAWGLHTLINFISRKNQPFI